MKYLFYFLISCHFLGEILAGFVVDHKNGNKVKLEIIGGAENDNMTSRGYVKRKYVKRKDRIEVDHHIHHHYHHHYHHHHYYHYGDEVPPQLDSPSTGHYEPKCFDFSEEWSYDCDVECENQGFYENEDDFTYRSFGKNLRCGRMLSETKAPKRIRDKYKEKPIEDNHMHINYYPEKGQCVCKKGYARLRGRCVKFDQCPLLNCNLDTEFYVACAPCPKTCHNFRSYDIRVMDCGACFPSCVCKYGLVKSPIGQCIASSLCEQPEKNVEEK